MYDAISKKKK